MLNFTSNINYYFTRVTIQVYKAVFPKLPIFAVHIKSSSHHLFVLLLLRQNTLFISFLTSKRKKSNSKISVIYLVLSRPKFYTRQITT